VLRKKHLLLFSCITLKKYNKLNKNFRQNSWWNAHSKSIKIICIILKCFCYQRRKPDVSKSVVTATRVTVGDHIIVKCSWINKKYEANHFLKMFADRWWSFNGLKHLAEKVTAVASTRVLVVVDHTMPTPLQRSTELKISHWYFDQCLYPQDYLLSKISWASVFLRNFFHSRPLNEMFIVNGKSHCCNHTFTDVLFSSLLAKNI